MQTLDSHFYIHYGYTGFEQPFKSILFKPMILTRIFTHYEIRRCHMISNETTIKQKPRDNDVIN